MKMLNQHNYPPEALPVARAFETELWQHGLRLGWASYLPCVALCAYYSCASLSLGTSCYSDCKCACQGGEVAAQIKAEPRSNSSLT
jgi:hypothetical protein